jgi:hypothetical protein
VQGDLVAFPALREHNVAPDWRLAGFRGVDFGAPHFRDYDEVFTVSQLKDKEVDQFGTTRDPDVIDAPSYYWYVYFHVPSRQLVDNRENVHAAICRVFQACLNSKTEVGCAAGGWAHACVLSLTPFTGARSWV